MSVTNLTGYTWVANDELGLMMYNMSFNVNFEVGNTSYTEFTMFFEDDDIIHHGIKYDDVIIYDDLDLATGDQWMDETYKTVKFTGGDGATDAWLISWIEENGTLTAPGATAALKLFNLTANNFKLGSSQINKLYLGSQVLWEYTANS